MADAGAREGLPKGSPCGIQGHRRVLCVGWGRSPCRTPAQYRMGGTHLPGGRVKIEFQAMVNGMAIGSTTRHFVDARTELVGYLLRLSMERALALGSIEDYVTGMWDAIEESARLTLTDNEGFAGDDEFAIEMVIK